MVEHLLQTGANVHARDDGGLIPLHNACSFGHAEVVSLLLCHGADPNARDNWNYTPLHEAAIKGKIDVCIGKKIRRPPDIRPLKQLRCLKVVFRGMLHIWACESGKFCSLLPTSVAPTRS